MKSRIIRFVSIQRIERQSIQKSSTKNDWTECCLLINDIRCVMWEKDKKSYFHFFFIFSNARKLCQKINLIYFTNDKLPWIYLEWNGENWGCVNACPTSIELFGVLVRTWLRMNGDKVPYSQSFLTKRKIVRYRGKRGGWTRKKKKKKTHEGIRFIWIVTHFCWPLSINTMYICT